MGCKRFCMPETYCIRLVSQVAICISRKLNYCMKQLQNVLAVCIYTADSVFLGLRRQTKILGSSLAIREKLVFKGMDFTYCTIIYTSRTAMYLEESSQEQVVGVLPYCHCEEAQAWNS